MTLFLPFVHDAAHCRPYARLPGTPYNAVPAWRLSTGTTPKNGQACTFVGPSLLPPNVCSRSITQPLVSRLLAQNQLRNVCQYGSISTIDGTRVRAVAVICAQSCPSLSLRFHVCLTRVSSRKGQRPPGSANSARNPRGHARGAKRSRPAGMAQWLENSPVPFLFPGCAAFDLTSLSFSLPLSTAQPSSARSQNRRLRYGGRRGKRSRVLNAKLADAVGDCLLLG